MVNFFQTLILGLMISVAGVSLAAAQTRRGNQTVEQIAARIAEAYDARDLGRLDSMRLIRGKIRVVIGYSYLEEKDRQPDTVRDFRSFKELEKWLTRRQAKAVDNVSRTVETLKECRRGICIYDDERGSLHNQLYLEEVYYRYRKGRYYIRALYLWNGD